MEPKEETLATIPEEEEDGDTVIPDVENNPKPTTKDNSSDSSDASDSDSDSDSESEDEAKQSMELQTLQYQLSNEPSNYDTHVQYIKVLRKMGEIEKLRQAREAMNEIFPLTPAMWREWARDETSISTGPEALLGVEKIYERGVSDYLSVPLWCDYLKFVQEYDPSIREFLPDGISKARNLFERAVTAAGLHVSEGSKIWELYREFELDIFCRIDETNLKEKEKQVQRIRSIFHRQLSVPLANSSATLLAYKSWEVEQGAVLDVESSNLDGISSNVALAYQKALEMCNARAHLEEQISRQDLSDSEKFQQYMIYLKYEQSSGDPGRVQLLYERAITDFPVSSDLWLDYTQYLDKTLKVGNVVRDVYSRATKNCPWVGELWVRSLLSLERSRASEEEISTVFEKSLLCAFSTFEEYLDLFLTRIDGLRRRILFSGEVEGVLDYSLIRETFQRASDYLSEQMKNTDGLLRLYAYWAHLEQSMGKDMVSARGVWERLLKISGAMLEAWQSYISMEIELDHINEARSIYKRCYSKRFTGTGSEVTPRLEELRLFRSQQESKSLPESADQKEHSVKKTGREKRKSDSNISYEQSPAKRQKHAPQKPKKVHDKEKRQVQNLAEENEGRETKQTVEEQPKKQPIKDAVPGRTKGFTDECTAFLSNINLKATYEDLRRFFSDVGGVSSIRILHDKFTGKSRGLAYVDFIDDEHLAAAVAKNKQMFLGKKLSIARSNPKQRKDSSGERAPTEHAQSHQQTGNAGTSASKESSIETSKQSRGRGDSVQLKGKNTFAVPRNVRPLGFPAIKPKTEEGEDLKPKSNDEFRKMFIKKD
ncbi:squamous cell carcinoma antigen recognized by T-cells 3 isoform X2 [Citrus clementina]|uniref:squamous cell carcinoma antigen recognized by T-cells 3 isoform X2 n=1 Tax=Citrus clementina TaxID=85681 RepID=UPI000CED5BD8|nr:squamous cell carcinoma antigen recognized by T-cells 3 isoform X2 [Citrus x clementina]